MRNHYLPRHYLKNFCNPDNQKLYVYNKFENNFFYSAVNNICVERDFYSDDTEKYLSEDIEGRAIEALNRLRSHAVISADEKQVLSEYFVVLYKRVPRAKEFFDKVAPRVKEKIKKQYNFPDDIINRIDSKDNGLWNQTIAPETTPLFSCAVNRMNWTTLYYTGQQKLLTCDSPVFFFEFEGIGHEQGEISIPLSSTSALWLTWDHNVPDKYEMPLSWVKELNRRTANNAISFIIYHKKEEWLRPFLKKPRWRLNRFVY